MKAEFPSSVFDSYQTSYQDLWIKAALILWARGTRNPVPFHAGKIRFVDCDLAGDGKLVSIAVICFSIRSILEL